MTLYVGGTSLLLHGDGANDSTVFTDETGKTVTPYGNAHISTAQSKFGGSSMYFDGTGDYLTFPSSGVAFGNGNFTIEAWIYLPETPSGLFSAVVDIRNTGAGAGMVLFAVDSSLGLVYYGVATLRTGAVLQLNQWVHVALCREGTVSRIFCNGVVVGTITDSDNKVLVTTAFVGAVFDSVNVPFKGYIEDLRIVNGIAIYTADFTPPSAPLGIVAPIQVKIQQQDPGLHKLAKYDPSQAKPVISEVKNDLQDRWPYGPWKTPAVRWEFKGRGRIVGTVAEKALPVNTPLRRLVRLHREPDGMFVQAVWSDTAGNYTFNGVRPDCKYFVTSFDYTGTYRAVIADNLSPTPL